MEQLNKLCKRDNAILVGEYSKITITTVINFQCKCSNNVNKTIRLLRVTGLYCDDCIKNKKGFYQIEPDNHDKCSVCGVKPICEESIVEDNWETCWGRNMFFCPNHRVQYPCNNNVCEADVCYNYKDNKNWKNSLNYWDYDNEIYN